MRAPPVPHAHSNLRSPLTSPHLRSHLPSLCDGRYLTKRNTFSDFVDTAQSLVDGGWTSPAMLAIEGRSAGGLLMGAVLNMAPQLFKVALAGVPFVDIMVTMADASIPLTVGEWCVAAM
jgi:oligopeptidase B